MVKTKEQLLKEAYVNFDNIMANNAEYKYSKIGHWLLIKSQKMQYEINFKKYNYTHRIYPRGTIVRVDFGAGLGSELCGIHFAITLTKNDNIVNDMITVVPLTSTPNSVITPITKIEDMVKKYLKSLRSILNKIDVDEMKGQKIDKDYKREIIFLISEYTKYLHDSYICLNQITAVSKFKMTLKISKNDSFLKRNEICNKKVIEEIDLHVIKLLTDYDLTKK
jgi:hypothetical protein